MLSSLLIHAQTVDTYNFAASTGTFTPLPATAVAVSTIQTDDALSAALPLGFSFVFDGTSFTTCKASSNGWLTFNPAASGSSLNNDLANGMASERPRVAPFWEDLNGATGRASYLTTGTAPNRVFTFEWLNWYRFGATGPSFSMQVQLVESTNEVRFVYRRDTNPAVGASASIGLSGTGSGSGSFLSLNSSGASPAVSSTVETTTIATTPATGQVYAFTPPVPSACPTPRNLASATTNTSALVTFTTTNSSPGPFTVQYGPVGFNPALPSSGTNVYTTITTPSNQPILTGLAPQTTYQFYVTQNCGGTAGNSNRSNAGSFTTDPNPAVNDNCLQAIVLSVGATCASPTSGTVFGATQSNVGPLTSCTSSTANDVWYSFVANGRSQTITFNPQFAGILDVRSGNCATSLSTFCASTAAGVSSTSNVGGLTAGQTYYLRVYASGTAQPAASASTFSLCVATGPAVPANDDCAGAVPLSIGTVCASPVMGTVLAATQSMAPTPGCAASTANDVWYSFVATGPSQIFTFAPDFAGVLNVRAGTCALSTSVMCATTAAGATSNTTATGLTAGQAYFVRVYASSFVQPSPTASSFLLCASGRPTATRAQADTEALLVFPNPSNTGQLTLRLTSPAGPGQAVLLNALGQTVRQQPLNGALEQTFSTRFLAAGLYTLRVTVGGQVLTRKVVLE